MEKLPGDKLRRANVRVMLPRKTSGVPASVDGFSEADENWLGSMDFYNIVTYNITVRERDGKRVALMEWVDVYDGEPRGHRVTLPSKVVSAIGGILNQLDADKRSERAQKGAATRRANGFIPFVRAESA